MSSPARFAEWASGGRWVSAPHLEVVSDEIVGMVVGDSCDILVVELPVRHGKSELCSRYAPAWFQCRWPNLRVGLASYEADFAASWGRKARTVLEERGDRFGVGVSQASSSASRFDLAGFEGGMWTAGAGGPITGKGWDLGVVDDPVKDDREARSNVLMEQKWEWLEQTWLTRRNLLGSPKMILVMSRWAFHDMSGRLQRDMRGFRVRVVHLPAIEDGTSTHLGRAVGEPLWDRIGVEQLRVVELAQPGAWPALYQQAPTTAEGVMFRPGDVRRFRWMGEGDLRSVLLLGDGGERLFGFGELARFCTIDLAVGVKKRNDWTVVSAWGATPDGDLLWLGLERVRAESTEHLALVEASRDRWGWSWAGVEAITFGISLLQQARKARRRGGAGVSMRALADSDKDKVTRARGGQGLWLGHRVFMPQGEAWTELAVQELAEFPNGKHDDMVDTFAYAAVELLNGTVGGVGPDRRRRDPGEPLSVPERIWEQIGGRRGKRGKGGRHPVLGDV